MTPAPTIQTHTAVALLQQYRAICEAAARSILTHADDIDRYRAGMGLPPAADRSKAEAWRQTARECDNAIIQLGGQLQ